MLLLSLTRVKVFVWSFVSFTVRVHRNTHTEKEGHFRDEVKKTNVTQMTSLGFRKTTDVDWNSEP